MVEYVGYQQKYRHEVCERYADAIPSIPELDAKRFMVALEERVRAYIQATGVKRLAFGMSGDKDSAVIAAALSSLDLEIEIVGVYVSMEENGGGEPLERVCSVQSDFPKIKLEVIRGYPAWQEHLKEVRFEEESDGYLTSLHQHIITMVVEKIRAERSPTVIVGALNRTEYLTGAFPKDMFVDFLPLVGLYKTWVADLGDHLGLPYNVRRRKPPFQRYTGNLDEVSIDDRGNPVIDEIWSKVKNVNGTVYLPGKLHLLLDSLYYQAEYAKKSLEEIEGQYPLLQREVKVITALANHFSYKLVPRQNTQLRWKHTDPWQNEDAVVPVHILDKEQEFAELRRTYLRT